MTTDPTQDLAFVDAVARRVIELLDAPPSAPGSQLLTVAEVAARYRVQPSWVYAHQRDLGVVRLGDGPKARLRFDAQVVASALSRHPRGARRRDEDHQPQPRRRRRLPSRAPPPRP